MSEQELTRENKPKRDEKGRLLPGNTANPAGRPEGSISVVSAIKKKLQECPEGKQKTYLHYLVEKIMKKAVIDDDVSMIKDIIDRVDGKPQQRTDLTTGGKELPQPLLNLNAIRTNNSNDENSATDQED
jgi:hypothetical protein